MSSSNFVSLHSLLNRREIYPLLRTFEKLMPHTRLAIIRLDGRLHAGAGDWPLEKLAEYMANISQSPFTMVEDLTGQGLFVNNQAVGALIAQGTVDSALFEALHQSLSLLLKQAQQTKDVSQETLERYREINLLYNIGETIASCLDPDEIHHLVLDEAQRIIQANAGGVLVPSSQAEGHLVARANFGTAEYTSTLYQVSRQLIRQVYKKNQPAISTDISTNDAQIESVLCAPLRTQKRVLGVILLGRSAPNAIFTASEEKLLMALAGQAATAVENAHLFAHLTNQRDAITAMKNHMDNIFASIASGVITTNIEDAVTTVNRAAEIILEVDGEASKGQPYIKVFPGFGSQIVPLIDEIKESNNQLIGHEIQSTLPRRGTVSLRLHLSPLKNRDEYTTGVAIVVDDLTERRLLEEKVQQVRATFERYVVPQVVDQLLSNPDTVKLGGAKRDISILFADVRNFTTFSHRTSPERLVDILNQHLTVAAEVILAEQGTLDKFMGDAVMAIFNAPLAQERHPVIAIRAALALQEAVKTLHRQINADEQLHFGIGISSGLAVVGNLGSTAIQNYTAIGDSVNTAQRLQAQARGGQILINAATYHKVKADIISRKVGAVTFKGHSEPELIYEVVGLK